MIGDGILADRLYSDLLFTEGADLEIRNKDLYSALMSASDGNHPDVLRLLLDAGEFYEWDAIPFQTLRKKLVSLLSLKPEISKLSSLFAHNVLTPKVVLCGSVPWSSLLVPVLNRK